MPKPLPQKPIVLAVGNPANPTRSFLNLQGVIDPQLETQVDIRTDGMGQPSMTWSEDGSEIEFGIGTPNQRPVGLPLEKFYSFTMSHCDGLIFYNIDSAEAVTIWVILWPFRPASATPFGMPRSYPKTTYG